MTQHEYLTAPAVSITRSFTGLAVEGQMFRLLFTAQGMGKIGVQCIALPASTGWDRAARMGEDGVPAYFDRTEIRLASDRLECLAVTGSEYAPYYRAGFVVALELGMSEAIVTVLPKVQAVVKLAQKLEDIANAERGDHPSVWSVYEGNLPAIAAWALLDGFAPAGAVSAEMDRYRQSKDHNEAEDNAFAAFCELVERALPKILEEQTT